MNLTFEQAAAVPVSGTTALQALRDAGRLEAGQKVMIIGAAEGVGSFAVQLAKASGVCNGTLVIVGGEGGGRWTGGFDRSLRAMLLSPFVAQTLRALISSDNGEDLQVLRGLIEAGKVRPVIDTIYPLTDAPEAIHHLKQGHACGKVIITI